MNKLARASLGVAYWAPITAAAIAAVRVTKLGGCMEKRAEKLVISKETLRTLDDQDLSSVVGGTGTIVCLNTVVCNSVACKSLVCHSGICI